MGQPVFQCARTARAKILLSLEVVESEPVMLRLGGGRGMGRLQPVPPRFEPTILTSPSRA